MHGSFTTKQFAARTFSINFQLSRSTVGWLNSPTPKVLRSICRIVHVKYTCGFLVFSKRTCAMLYFEHMQIPLSISSNEIRSNPTSINLHGNFFGNDLKAVTL